MDATNRNTALASAFVEELARCGVRHAVLSPGSRSTPLAVALWRQPAIEVSVIVDERYDDQYEGGRDPGLAHGLATQRLFAETIASRECELRDGFLHLAEGPGLGVEIDDAALEAARL